MNDIKNTKINEIVKEIHEAMDRKIRRSGITNEHIVLESRIYELLCLTPELPPRECAKILNEKYNYNLYGDNIIQILKKQHLGNPVERRALFEWANDTIYQLHLALKGNKEAFQKFETLRKENTHSSFAKGKILTIMTFLRCKEINSNNNFENILGLGNTLARYFFYDITDAIANAYNFPQTKAKNKNSRYANKHFTYEELTKQVERLENTLDRTNLMLQDLQDEFDEQLEASKIQEQVEFFSKLNSEYYGCILDELLMLRKGVQDLKKNGIEPPIELSGILIMVRKFIQFVRDSKIEPLRKLGQIEQVTAKDIENCHYEGTPFNNENETKNVKITSPGWIYREKDIPISRPKVQEIIE